MNRMILIAIGVSAIGMLHLAFTSMPEVKETAVIIEVKRFYADNCTYGREIDEPYYKCKDVMKFINKFERK